MNFKPLLNLFSILVILFSFSFIFPIIVSLIYKDAAITIFIRTFLIVFVIGFIGWLVSRKHNEDLNQKDGFLIITLFWLVLSVAGSIPFVLSGMSYMDAFFEAMSGITTTGATVISNLQSLPESMLFGRKLPLCDEKSFRGRFRSTSRTPTARRHRYEAPSHSARPN